MRVTVQLGYILQLELILFAIVRRIPCSEVPLVCKHNVLVDRVMSWGVRRLGKASAAHSRKRCKVACTHCTPADLQAS